jgi:GTPase SAR1 family protein
LWKEYNIEEVAKIFEIDEKNAVIVMGDVIMGDKNKYKDIQVNSQNSSIGDYNEVNQTNIKIDRALLEALNDIEFEISKLKESEEKLEAELYLELLSDSIQKNEKGKIKTSIQKLSKIINNTASLMTIASFFGISIPS